MHQARDALDEQVKEKTRALVHANKQLKEEIEERESAAIALAESEGQFRQSQKMEPIGTMVGGIAHDFNNMIAGVMAHLYMLDKDLTGDSKAKERLGKINHLLTSAAEMIKQLMTFDREHVLEKPFTAGQLSRRIRRSLDRLKQTATISQTEIIPPAI